MVALTDGVVAVIITIMVLALKPPHGADLTSLRELGLTFLSFVLSFVYVAIYWNTTTISSGWCRTSPGRSCEPTSTCCSGCR